MSADAAHFFKFSVNLILFDLNSKTQLKMPIGMRYKGVTQRCLIEKLMSAHKLFLTKVFSLLHHLFKSHFRALRYIALTVAWPYANKLLPDFR